MAETLNQYVIEIVKRWLMTREMHEEETLVDVSDLFVVVAVFSSQLIHPPLVVLFSHFLAFQVFL